MPRPTSGSLFPLVLGHYFTLVHTRRGWSPTSGCASATPALARTPAGIRLWDCPQTITGTAAKLGVNVLHYLRDPLSGIYRLPALADLIRQRTAASTPDDAAPPLLAAARRTRAFE